MRYYSDITKKFYDTDTACQEAEALFEKELNDAIEKRKERDSAISKEKKELATAIEDAETKLSEAYQNYDLAKEETSKIYDKAKEDALKILKPASEAVTAAQKERYQAISNFNKKFGVYTTSYSGAKAYNELLRTSKIFDNLFNSFFTF